jgi:hypothetical protein
VGEHEKGFGGWGASVWWVPCERKESDCGVGGLFNGPVRAGEMEREGAMRGVGGSTGTIARRGAVRGLRRASKRDQPSA